MSKLRLPCRNEDPELWFPVGEGTLAQEQAWLAKQLCHACPIEEICLEHALETGQLYGVWGGTDEHERRAMIRRGAVEIRRINASRTTRTDLVRKLASQP